MHPSADQCELSVVVAADGDAQAADGCIGAILTATRGLNAEVILVRAGDGEGAAAQSGLDGIVIVAMPARTLTPRLWSEGYHRARGRVVAFTTTRFRVGEGWAKALIGGVARGWSGAGGNISIAPNTSVADWAAYFLRYSAFMAEATGVTTDHEIAGDNAAYRKDVMDTHRGSFATGFWEVEYHRRLRRDGGALGFVAGAEASYVGGVRAGELFAARFAHGRHFARWRIAESRVPRLRVVLAAPVVPLVLVARIARRALPRPGHRIRFLVALPVLTWFAIGWAAGEFWGGLVSGAAGPVSEVAA